jgi:two-component system, chemotaxis family, protein-glutamate methylesterase/glutaminase
VIRVLAADDSALMRRLIGEALACEGGFETVFARDGVEALELAARFDPQVVTLDVEMPRLDGLACLDRMMLERPRPVVVLSARTGAGADETLRAFALGAVEVLEKPAGPATLSWPDFAPRLVDAVSAAAAARLSPALRLAERVRRQRAEAEPRRPAPRPSQRLVRAPGLPPSPAEGEVAGVVLVGASTGGPNALEVLLGGLPADLRWAVVVAQHMPASFTGALARRLDGLCAIGVEEVLAPTPLLPGRAYIGRGDADVLVSLRGGRPVVLPAPVEPGARWRPSVDRLVHSALETLGPARLAGVLMTGMGDDGAAAMAELQARGGPTLAESETTAVVWGMPGALVRRGGAGEVADLDALATALLRALEASR